MSDTAAVTDDRPTTYIYTKRKRVCVAADPVVSRNAASYSCPDGPATSLEDPGKLSCWKGGVGDGWVLLKL